MQKFPCRIGVAGMHGKSTTTAMLSKIFCEAKKDPCVLCGAAMHDFSGKAYRLSQREQTVIYEACEYQDAFLSLPPTQALLLNVDYDHVDYFSSMQQICTSFLKFAAQAKTVIANADDPYLSQALSPLRKKVTTFGIRERADYTAVHIEVEIRSCRFTLCLHDVPLAQIEVPMGGEHSVKNALAAAACAHQNGMDAEVIAASMRSFSGLCRRMEFIGILNGAPVYSDYAHHPTELNYALSQAEAVAHARGGRLFCVFQSHTYSRTHALFDGFAKTLQTADVLCILPVFAAREQNAYGNDALRLSQKAKGRYYESAQALAKALQNEVSETDTILLAGAGDFDGLCDLI